MRISVADAAKELEAKGLLKRTRADHADRIIAHVRAQLDLELPVDLEDFYREGISRIGEFQAVLPLWNDQVGWRPTAIEASDLLHAQAVPIFLDGAGSLFGLDLSVGNTTPAVYFFDHEERFKAPQWAAGSSLGTFLLLLADGDRAHREGWPPKWELAIDPDIEKCARAPAIWNAG